MIRVIYSLLFELDCSDGFRDPVAPLDRGGQAEHCRPIGKGRVIDLRVGDCLRHAGGVHRIIKVKAYRDHVIPAGQPLPSDGYAYQMS